MSIKILFKDLAFYGLIDIIQRSIGVLLIPYYIRALSITEYGNFDIFIIISSIVLVLIDFQLIQAFNRFYYEFISNDKRKRLAGTVLKFRFLIGLFLAIILIFIGKSGGLENNFMPKFSSFTTEWILIIIFPIVTSFYDGLIAHSRMTKEKKAFTTLALTSVIISSVLSVIFVEYFSFGIIGLILGLFLGKLLASFFGFIQLHKKIILCLDKDILKEILKYSAPLIPGWWLAFITTYFCRFFVFEELGPANNAILAIAMKALIIVNVFTLSFRSAWQPIAMSLIKNKKSNKFYINSSRILIFSLILISFILTLSIDLIVDIVLTESYSLVANIFPIFIVASIISELEFNFQLGCQLSKKTIWITMGSILSFIISLIILFVYTEIYELFAVGYALLLSSLVKIVVVFISSQKLYFIDYSIKSIFLFFVGCISLLLFSYSKNHELIDDRYLKLVILLIGLLICSFLIKKDEYLIIIDLIKNKYLK